MTESIRRAPLSADLLPASGAWQPGDPVGHRRFVALPEDRVFSLEGGGTLRNVTVAYETWGELNDDRSNAILVCHALTGDSHAAGAAEAGHPTDGWWDDVIGPGLGIDTNTWFVVCANVLGGCQGTSGPSSIDPSTGRPYGSNFPVVTIRDIVRTQVAVADELGIARWFSVIGGSMGGMQALEWSIMYPERVGSLVALATTPDASPLQIGFSSVQRSTIVADPRWRGGDYYGAEPGDGPHMGLALARETAQITYRSSESYDKKFGRSVQDPMDNGFTPWQRFGVENYLDYHGAKLVRRFDANSYLVINKAMDLHDVGRGRGGVERALKRISGPVLTVSISSDTLYPESQQKRIHDVVAANGVKAKHELITSDEGHDGFLTEHNRVGTLLKSFLKDVGKNR